MYIFTKIFIVFWVEWILKRRLRLMEMCLALQPTRYLYGSQMKVRQHRRPCSQGSKFEGGRYVEKWTGSACRGTQLS